MTVYLLYHTRHAIPAQCRVASKARALTAGALRYYALLASCHGCIGIHLFLVGVSCSNPELAAGRLPVYSISSKGTAEDAAFADR